MTVKKVVIRYSTAHGQVICFSHAVKLAIQGEDIQSSLVEIIEEVDIRIVCTFCVDKEAAKKQYERFIDRIAND